jgi:hypothetical protein
LRDRAACCAKARDFAAQRSLVSASPKACLLLSAPPQVAFTGRLFTPAPWTPTTKMGMPVVRRLERASRLL